MKLRILDVFVSTSSFGIIFFILLSIWGTPIRGKVGWNVETFMLGYAFYSVLVQIWLFFYVNRCVVKFRIKKGSDRRIPERWERIRLLYWIGATYFYFRYFREIDRKT